MCDEVLSFGDISRSNGQCSCYDSLISANSYSNDYIYQLEYEKRKHIDQIKSLQRQLDLSDRRNSELSEEITAANNLNHRHSDDTGYPTSEPVLPIQVSNFEMNKCELKSIGEEIENALSEISVYKESSETEISGTEEKEIFQTKDKSVERSPILLTENDISRRR
ncbi:unnamed protein product [Hymenolepis diminuta]|uniref:Uncharacterized protein n=1 Tax=Hymenolepis diminuta TaxID=6216 RepID=A0A0R3SJN2_HYMDI|nr:unnamed protein product [Hymenolepis diminuta]